MGWSSLALLHLFLHTSVAFHSLRKTDRNETVFDLGNATYFANIAYPAAVLETGAGGPSWDTPITLIHTNASRITAAGIADVLARYADGDDVFSMAFTPAIFIKTSSAATMDSSAVDYLASIKSRHIVTSADCSVALHTAVKSMTISDSFDLPPGPYFASFSGGSVALSKVYRLYEDVHRDFLYGAYPTEDGTGRFTSLGVSMPQFGYPAIPIPSRIYSWNDPRPFAGYRVAIKDLFDMKGLTTTGGSQAWALVNTVANATAPSIQRILDLGGVLVGKYKLAQFASGADPWEWQDEYEDPPHSNALC